MSNVRFKNITSDSQADFIRVALESTVQLNNISYTESSTEMLLARDSEMSINGLEINNISEASILLEIASCSRINMQNIQVQNASVTGSSLVDISESEHVSIDGLLASYSSQVVLNIQKSSIDLLDNFVVEASLKALQIESSIVTSLSNSTFTSNGDTTHKAGGTISISNSEVSITNSAFSHNIAKQGGAIYFTCSSLKL